MESLKWRFTKNLDLFTKGLWPHAIDFSLSTFHFRLWGILLISLVSSCQSLIKSPKYQFSDGYYKTYGVGAAGQRYYIENLGDTLLLTDAMGFGEKTPPPQTVFIKEVIDNKVAPPKRVFTKASFDVDILSIPVQVRPKQAHVPPQLNYSLSGAVYIGRRVDRYAINYDATPLGHHRRTSHYGLSFGGIAGISSVFVSPTNTAFHQNLEYDGLALTGGIAMILGVNQFSFGLIGAMNYLPDQNRHIWIYQTRPWIGLGIGLNLN